MATKVIVLAGFLFAISSLIEAFPEPYPGGGLLDEWGSPVMKRCNSGGCSNDNQGEGQRKKKNKKMKKEPFCGIDFSQQRGQPYVRFVLASSVGFPNTNTTPMVIDTQECMSGTWKHDLNDLEAVDTDYNKHSLRLYKLVGATGARNCQSYYMHDGGGASWDTKSRGGYPFAVSIANDTKVPIGWDMDNQGKITWVKSIQYNELSGQLLADCKSWYKECKGKVRYFGQNCLLRVRNSADRNMCLSAPREDDKTQKIGAMACARSEPRQIWHLQSTATEYPAYLGNCGEDCWGKRYNKDPLQFYQVTGDYLQGTTVIPDPSSTEVTINSDTATGTTDSNTANGTTDSNTATGTTDSNTANETTDSNTATGTTAPTSNTTKNTKTHVPTKRAS